MEMQNKPSLVQRAGAIGWALLAWLFSGSLIVAVIVFLLLGGC